ncbi:MAG: penicillin-binding protein 2 [Paludibacteraceae bacterium]|nr:penicillin-binding protein 2 [Paludibacteraceae bacterium]
MINPQYYKRAYVLGGIVVAVALVFVGRLFYLQVIDTSTKDKADGNALVRQTIYPSRGLIYDRNDSLIVFNQPVYDVMIVVKEMRKGFDTLSFCHAMQISREQFEERMSEVCDRRRNRGYSAYVPQLFWGMLSKEDVAAVQERLFNFAGVSVRKRTLRDYVYPSAAHIVGSVGEVNRQDLESDSYYAIGDYSGRDGIERQYEVLLRGKKGVEVLMRDSKGRIQGSYHNGELDYSAESGTDLQLTIDIRLQQLAEDLLQGKMGSAVAIEPKTGEVLAMVSVPSWDPHSLVGRQRSKNYAALLNDPHKPLMNRAVQAQYPPGSTFKLIQALVGLQTGAITPSTLYGCNGPGSTPIKCTHHHGSPVSLEAGIEQSCNPYFWQAYRDILEQHGYGKNNAIFRRSYDHWRDLVVSFGFAQRFESDISNQVTGSIPRAKTFSRIYGETGWRAITIRSLSIGQGEILVTPLQLANEAACIANSGYYMTPHLVRPLPSMPAIERHQTGVDSCHFDVVQRGMARVMTNGTGRWYNIPELQMCGKTGTVQNPHGKDHAIFIGFAPLDNPQIAVAVVVENAGFGATWACPVATMMMEKYLTDSISRPDLYDRIRSAHFINTQAQ